MSLPKIEHPTYEVELTSRGLTKYRPFLVKEQKILMMAAEDNDLKDYIKPLKQVIENCLLEKIDIDALPLVDLEILFINMRAKSMGEIMDVYFKCKNEVPDINNPEVKKECGMILEIPVNLSEVKVESDLNNPIIDFGNGMGVKMHYPSFDLFNLMKNNENRVEGEYVVVAGCIDYIYDKESIFKASEADPMEVQDFVMNLPIEIFEKLEKFVSGSPRVKATVKKKCPKCDYDHSMTLEGLSDFFL